MFGKRIQDKPKQYPPFTSKQPNPKSTPMNTEREIKNLKQQFQSILEKLDRLIDLGQDVENRLIALEKRSNESDDATTSDVD
jgi:hypothetical protein